MIEILEVPILADHKLQGRHFLEDYIIHSLQRQVSIQYCECRLNAEKVFFLYIINDLSRPENYLITDRIIPKAPFSLLLTEQAQSGWTALYDQYTSRYETPLFIVTEQTEGNSTAAVFDSVPLREKSNVVLYYDKDDQDRVKKVLKKALQQLLELSVQ